MHRIFAAALAVFATTDAAEAQTARLNPTTDVALINGRIHTMDAEGTIAEAIGIEGDEIVYVGDAEGLGRVIGFGIEVIDLEGAMVLPGFVDGHIHAVVGGLIMLGVGLQTDDREELLARIRQEAAENDAELILGHGVRFNVWTDGNPTAAMLDEIEAERPVYLWAIDGHAAWVNSKALELAGIDKDTPDTAPGFSFFERDADGNPTGWIVEVPAQLQVLSALLDITPEFLAEGVEVWMGRFAAAGITAAHDHGIQGMSEREGFDMLLGFERRGALPMRVVGSHYWNDPQVDPLPGIAALRADYDTELVKARYLKINMDGGDDKWNAIYVDPYTDRPDLRPEPIIPYAAVEDAVIRADALGIDVTCHCFGDLAVRYLLDAVEAAVAANPPRDRRHKITHGTLIHPDDYARFAELGVIYDTTGTWMSLDPLMQSISASRLGMERMKAMFPVNRVV
ncbi:MAG: amidohydrolase family protein, partial [Pseudomonadota bacterium]